MEILMDGLQLKAYQEYPPPSQNWNLSWRTWGLGLARILLMEDLVQGTGVWKLIAVSPMDTVSFIHVCFSIVITKAVDLELLKFRFKYIRK